MEQRTCPVCLTAFVPTHHNQRFCPPTKEDRARDAKGQTRSRCAKRYENHVQRHGVPPLGPATQPFDCAHCGKPCVPGRNVVPQASRFCGYHCKSAWHSHHIEGRERRPAELVVFVGRDRGAITRWRVHCDDLALEDAGFDAKAHDITAYRKALRRDPCSYCGGPADSLDHIDAKDAGGEDGWANRTSACRLCNSYKGTKPLLFALLWVPVAKEYHGLRRALHPKVGSAS